MQGDENNKNPTLWKKFAFVLKLLKQGVKQNITSENGAWIIPNFSLVAKSIIKISQYTGL